MRGQAFVVMHDEEQAESAIRTLRGYHFFGKPLRLNFSKNQSDFIAKRSGTFDEEAKARRERRN